MFSSPTIYCTGTGTIEVLPGESHSDAWTYVMRGGAFPERYPCTRDGAAGGVRRRMHSSGRRQAHRRRSLSPVA